MSMTLSCKWPIGKSFPRKTSLSKIKEHNINGSIKDEVIRIKKL